MVCQHLSSRGIRAVLTGGAVVSIYSDSRYLTADLDFITLRDIRDVQHAMSEIGFKKSTGRYFTHPDTDILVEFPPGPLAIGDSPVTATTTVEILNMKLDFDPSALPYRSNALRNKSPQTPSLLLSISCVPQKHSVCRISRFEWFKVRLSTQWSSRTRGNMG